MGEGSLLKLEIGQRELPREGITLEIKPSNYRGSMPISSAKHCNKHKIEGDTYIQRMCPSVKEFTKSQDQMPLLGTNWRVRPSKIRARRKV